MIGVLGDHGADAQLPVEMVLHANKESVVLLKEVQVVAEGMERVPESVSDKLASRVRSLNYKLLLYTSGHKTQMVSGRSKNMYFTPQCAVS